MGNEAVGGFESPPPDLGGGANFFRPTLDLTLFDGPPNYTPVLKLRLIFSPLFNEKS